MGRILRSPWQLLARDKYLWFIAGMVILLNWVNSSGEYLLDRTLLATAKAAATQGVSSQTFIGSFKADYYFWYNAIGVGLQLSPYRASSASQACDGRCWRCRCLLSAHTGWRRSCRSSR